MLKVIEVGYMSNASSGMRLFQCYCHHVMDFFVFKTNDVISLVSATRTCLCNGFPQRFARKRPPSAYNGVWLFLLHVSS